MTRKPKLLIVNRGEIAGRALQAAERLGWHAILFATEADRNTKAFRMAKYHHLVKNSHPQESYLNLAEIRLAIEAHQPDFVYPGYGFLSEHPDLARLCEELSVKFVGNNSELLQKMSDKSQAEVFAERCGLASLQYRANDELHFPLLLKAARGGGGRGNVVVFHDGEMQSKMEELQKRSRSLFHDDHVLVERYLERARHVELQVFGFSDGRVRVIGTRDCSVQRRFQKIIEEGPVAEEIQQEFDSHIDAIEKQLEAIGYQGAGTLEFLFDPMVHQQNRLSSLKKSALYFLEMNCRIQVEHPITEILLGVDLVEWQLLAASGRLSSSVFNETQLGKDHSPVQHVFEFRIYGENTLQNFFPSAGEIVDLFWSESPHVRCDATYEAGDSVSELYDPMLAKLLIAGKSREDALSKSQEILQQCFVHGVFCNFDILQAIVDSKDFSSLAIDVSWLEREVMSCFKSDLSKKVEDLERQFDRKFGREFGKQIGEQIDSLGFENLFLDANAAVSRELGVGPHTAGASNFAERGLTWKFVHRK